jgi:hypothetical protein
MALTEQPDGALTDAKGQVVKPSPRELQAQEQSERDAQNAPEPKPSERKGK